ncbi:MAG TPA: TolC family protein [Puia sp.]
MKKWLLLLSLPLTLLNITSHAQDKWNLQRCVDYALANNISIKQADIQARIAKLTLGQSKLSQIPTLGFGTGLGINSGRSQNPTNYTLQTNTYLYNNFGLQTSVTLFNGFNLQNTIAANHYAWQAALASSDKLKNDISLNVANAYLQVLLGREQEEAARLQLRLSQSQLEITRKQVKAGSLPELNAAELESQVAQDSSTYITSSGNIIQAILTLKAYMDLDASVPFEVDTPPVESIPIEKLSDLQPEAVYSLALNNQPLQKMDSFQVESARRTVKATKGARYPSLTMSGNLQTNYISTTQQQANPFLTIDTIGRVVGSNNPVVNDHAIGYTISNVKTPYFSQLNQYFSQSIGINLNIPILNNGILRTNYAKSKLSLRNTELQRDQDNLTLKQNIYQAYTAAVTALQKFEANKITIAATQKSSEYAQKRYGVGMLNTIDLLTNENNYFNAKINLLSSQYDYVFKMKVLEFYKGLGIKLSKE